MSCGIKRFRSFFGGSLKYMTCAGAEFGHNNRFQELYCVVIVLINPKARRMQCATLQKGGLAEFPVRVACIYGSCRVGQEEDGLIAGPYTEQHRPKAAVTATVNVVRTSLPVRSCWLYCNMRRAAKWVVCITHARRSPNLGRRPSAVSEGALACSDARAANRIWLPEVCAMKQQGGRSMEVLSLIFIVVAAQVNAMDRSLESRMTTLGRQNGPGAPATHGSSPRSESVPAGASQTFAQGAIVDADSVHLGKIEDVDDDDEQYVCATFLCIGLTLPSGTGLRLASAPNVQASLWFHVPCPGCLGSTICPFIPLV